MTPENKKRTLAAGTLAAVALTGTIAVLSRRRAVEPSPAPVTIPQWVTIGADPWVIPPERAFPPDENGRVVRVKCDGVESQCVVERGRCVALMQLVAGVEHKCMWGYDEKGSGGVAFNQYQTKIAEVAP